MKIFLIQMKFKMTVWSGFILYQFKHFYEKFVTNNRTLYNSLFGDKVDDM